METPTKPMLKEAANAGFYDSTLIREKFPKIQIVTIQQLLRGEKIGFPRLLEATYKKAPKAKAAAAEAIPLPLGRDVPFSEEADPNEEEED